MQLGELLAQLPPGFQQNFHNFAQIRKALHEFLDALFELGGADNANLETEIAQQAADIVFYGDGFSLEQLSRRQQRPLLLARQRLHMDRPEQIHAHHVRDAAGVIPIRLVDLRF